jgi:two-component system NtrC family sensor kinase
LLAGQERRLHNIEIKKLLQPDLAQMLGDAQLIQQVIFNLLSNAYWAIQEKPGHKGGTITIRTCYILEENKIELYVSDSGIGIAQENLGKIFDPFFTTKASGEGTGLGLPIVYNIVQQHNGSIEVQSELGTGTTFKVSLPVISAK